MVVRTANGEIRSGILLVDRQKLSLPEWEGRRRHSQRCVGQPSAVLQLCYHGHATSSHAYAKHRLEEQFTTNFFVLSASTSVGCRLVGLQKRCDESMAICKFRSGRLIRMLDCKIESETRSFMDVGGQDDPNVWLQMRDTLRCCSLLDAAQGPVCSWRSPVKIKHRNLCNIC